MTAALRQVISDNRAGKGVAIPSVCSAHPEVLQASLLLAERLDRAVVIEATSNQVNQDGGYTGMRPADFVALVYSIAAANGVDPGRITFGGDHLGPQAWRTLPAGQAMMRARDMVTGYVQAGIHKIHLDCSEGCAGEAAQLPDEVTAARAADLAGVAAEAAGNHDLLFVVGTEVPPPGGARVDENGDISPTTPSSATATIAAHRDAMRDAWAQVGGLVVQPGVEFSPMQVHHLPMGSDPGLRAVMMQFPGLCLEAHSTDYQTDETYLRLAELGFAFQKVGPALTFAWRRALYALNALAAVAAPADARLVDVLEQAMLEDPRHWQGHYRGGDLRIMRHYGLADRVRYYWPVPAVQIAVKALFARLDQARLPDRVLAEVFCDRTLSLAEAISGPRPRALALAEVQAALIPYFFGGHR